MRPENRRKRSQLHPPQQQNLCPFSKSRQSIIYVVVPTYIAMGVGVTD
jgi:hypothetical protein